MLAGENQRAIERKRNRRVRGIVYAGMLAVSAAAVGFIDSCGEAVASKPDYYRIVFEELAHHHFLYTNAPIILKEDPKTLEFFQSQYDRANRHLGVPTSEVTAPESGLLTFDYIPGGTGLKWLSDEELTTVPDYNAINVRSTVVLWSYSR